MKEHIFVIKYTTENGWEWDTDTESARFEDGTIFDTVADEWRPAYKGEGEYEDDDDLVGEILGYALKLANQIDR